MRILCLILCFFLDVHVRADEALVTQNSIRKVSLKEGFIVLNARTLVEPKGKTLNLVHGQLLVEAGRSTKFTTPFGEAFCDSEELCRALFERTSDKWVIQSLAGNWHFKRSGDNQVYQLHVATQIQLGEVTTDGQAQMELPQSLPWDATVKTWAHLFQGKPEQFKDQVIDFRVHWQAAVEGLSQAQSETTKKAVENHEKELKIQAAARLTETRERALLRRELAERNYLELAH